MLRACEEGLWKKLNRSGLPFIRGNVLHEACERGNLRLVKSLIECGCDKESLDSHERTPLIIAARSGHLEIVNYLVYVGANLEANDEFQYTPLLAASTKSNNQDVIESLIFVGADKEAKNQHGETYKEIKPMLKI